MLSIFGLDIEYAADKGTLKCGDKEAPVNGENGYIDLRLIFDTVYTEVFADSGNVFMGMSYIQDSTLNRLSILSDNIFVKKLSVSEMKSFY